MGGTPPLVAASRTGELPLSFAEERMWFLHQLDPGSAAYHIRLTKRLRGQFDVEAMRRALEAVVRRHEILRTLFPSAAGVPRRRILDQARWELPVRELGEQLDAEELARFVDDDRQPFDLGVGPLFRSQLIRNGHDDHVLMCTMHHIITDGVSVTLLWRELRTLYDAFARGEPAELPALPVQYADYAAWQRGWLQGQALEAQLA